MITPEQIKKALEIKLSISDLSTQSRKIEFVYGRYLGYKLCKKFTNVSLESIGIVFNRSHSTVHTGITKFNNFENQSFFKNYLEVYNDIFKFFEPNKTEDTLKFYLESAVNEILYSKEKSNDIDYSFIINSINNLKSIKNDIN